MNFRQKELPTFYYLHHFTEFLKFVKGPCSSLLSQDNLQFIQQFEALNKDAQCLVVRALNRKSKFIKLSTMAYDEISNGNMHIEQLMAQGWFRHIAKDDIRTWLTTLTKSDLTALIKPHTKVMSAWPRAKLIEISQGLSATQLYDETLTDTYFVRTIDEHIDYFLYLYFGNCHSKLNQFSMRDLGVMRTRKEQAQILARFLSIESARSTFELHCTLSMLKETTFEDAHSIHQHLAALSETVGERAQLLDERIKYLLANALLAFDQQTAIQQLALINSDEAQEKWVREAYKLGLKDEVEQRLEALIDTPLSDHNLAFAEDFLARKYKKKRTSVLTDMLRDNSQTIALDEMHKAAVERGVVAYYQARKCLAQLTENQLWRSLFGLFFWEEIFETEGFGLVNEFDRMPLCLKKNNLYEIASKQIEHKLDAIKHSDELIKLLAKQASKHYGKTNDIFRWKQNLLALISPLLQHAPLNSVLQHLRSMSQDWHKLSDGYPDILVVEGEKLRFEEVKSEGDQLRRNQLLSIQTLKENGFDVRITNVEWTIDPLQPYVVVDIETTGGRAQQHKITEIGMVKMINNEIVDEWQSLINPQRRIPAKITALTGIDNQMVADAPLFAEVAEQVVAFTDGCIFVAHNVNFDYGFIKEEFARLEQRFKRPKLCTVSQMRKHYKGINSYSLANLTRHFDISMQRHHRAMSDAVAASELLKLINEKRLVNDA